MAKIFPTSRATPEQYQSLVEWIQSNWTTDNAVWLVVFVFVSLFLSFVIISRLRFF